MTKRQKPPHSSRVLAQWADAYARDRGLGSKRVRNWISYMVLGGQLERASASAEGPRFTIKGAVALEMRLPHRARATKDIDLMVSGIEHLDLAAVLRDAVDGTFQDFTFRVKGVPHLMPNDAVRLKVAIEYRGRSWSTLQVDLSQEEGGATEIELVEALELEPFGFSTPSALPCLSLRYHIAQKIHGVTQPSSQEDGTNERFRDLADLLLLRELVKDLAAVRAACVEVFAIRGTHAWPPALDPPAFWKEPYEKLAEGQVTFPTGGRPMVLGKRPRRVQRAAHRRAGLRNLPVGQVMAMELVGFPDQGDVGVCFTQVASPAWMLRANPPPWLTGAPVPDRRSEPAHVFLNLWRQEEPFRLHRLEVDLPHEAWTEADGRAALLQYGMKDQQGRAHRPARCGIPASQVRD